MSPGWGLSWFSQTGKKTPEVGTPMPLVEAGRGLATLPRFLLRHSNEVLLPEAGARPQCCSWPGGCGQCRDPFTGCWCHTRPASAPSVWGGSQGLATPALQRKQHPVQQRPGRIPCGRGGAARDQAAPSACPSWPSAPAPPSPCSGPTHAPVCSHTCLVGKGTRSCPGKQTWKGGRKITEAGSWETWRWGVLGPRRPLTPLPGEGGRPGPPAHRRPLPSGARLSEGSAASWSVAHAAPFVPSAGERPVGEGSGELRGHRGPHRPAASRAQEDDRAPAVERG